MNQRVPQIGMVSGPDTLNPLAATTEPAFTIINGVYGLGGVRHPNTGEVCPWLFESWELDPEAVGTDAPTVTARLRDGLAFGDGVRLTATDVVFTVNYSMDDTMPGAHGTSQYDAVERVTAPDPDGLRVEFYFDEPTNSWRRGVLGYPVLPRHVWEEVPDPSDYDPTADGGPVGAGHLRLVAHEPGKWYELGVRDQGTVWTEAIEWLDEDGPHVDRVRFEVYESAQALERAIAEGECDAPADGVSAEGVDRSRANDRRIVTTADTGWEHCSFNLRRKPLDDPAFRQTLCRLFDREFAAELHGGGSKPGSYVTPRSFDAWRPPEPTEIERLHGEAVPSLSFPGTEFQIGESGVHALREFLRTHSRAIHEYEFTETAAAPGDVAASGRSVDGKTLTVDGEPFAAVADGPLTITVQPPTESLLRYRLAGHWLTAMNRSGIPARLRVEPLSRLTERVFEQGAFDAFVAGWRNIAAENDHFTRMFSSRGVDETGAFAPNPMGYTAADELIEEQRRMFDPDRRRPLVRRLLVKIWRDAPTLVTTYKTQQFPTSSRFSGYVETLGGISRPVSWLSVCPEE